MAKFTQQLAALPWRFNRGALEILLITSRETKRWVIPKGWPMKGIAANKAAQQEAYEEAGIEGIVAAASIGHFTYIKQEVRDRWVRVEVFPLQVKKQLKHWPESAERVREWFPVLEAMQAVDELELRAVIAGFDP